MRVPLVLTFDKEFLWIRKPAIVKQAEQRHMHKELMPTDIMRTLLCECYIVYFGLKHDYTRLWPGRDGTYI